MSKRDFYETLGVSKGTTTDEIKKAYRKLAMKYHPDKNQGNRDAESKFKEINEAYEVLRDDQKRAAYDKFGHQAFEQGGGKPGGFDFNGNFDDISDIFGGIFNDFMGGRGGGQRRPSQDDLRGSDLRYNLTIDLETAYRGGKQQINFRTNVACDTCHGVGSKSGKKQKCSTCNGHGRIRAQQGFFMIERTCHVCGGHGEILSDPCSKCNGQGRVSQNRVLNVNIPQGVDDGTRIRIAGEGEAGIRGGKHGDLYVFINIKPHRIFTREGNNIACSASVKMTTAALGGRIAVPGLDGKYSDLEIPAGTQTNTSFTIRGKGMPVIQSSRFGDMNINVNVEVPVNLTDKQKHLLEEFEKECTEKTNPKTEGFFSKMKNFFDDLKS